MDDFRCKLRGQLAALLSGDLDASEIITSDAVMDVAAPVDQLRGAAGFAAAFLAPIRAAFGGAQRRDILFVGGQSRLHDQAQWCACITHYVGNFNTALFGLNPTGSLGFLRAGEFYKLNGDGQIVEAKILFDLPDLMRQAGRLPLPQLGTEITFPAPATQDGLCPTAPYDGDAFDVVDRMMAGLGAYDPETWSSEGQTGSTGVWTDDMLWYGPGGIGSNYEWSGCVQAHRAPFLTAFPDRKGGHHFCRFGDGAYAAMGGWPSIHATFAADYLGLAASGGPITMRVMDFYRIADRRLAENWVFIDLVDLFRQGGRNLVAEANALG